MLKLPDDKFTTLEDFIGAIIAAGKERPNTEIFEETFRELSDELIQSIVTRMEEIT